MIKITMVRKQVGEKQLPEKICHLTTERALEWLMGGHLRFYAKIMVCEPTRIQLGTQVMHVTDIDLAEGSEEEMKPLYQLCQWYLALRYPDDPTFELPHPPRQVIDSALPIGEKLVKRHGPLGAAIILGQTTDAQRMEDLAAQTLDQLIELQMSQVKMPKKSFWQRIGLA